ncbi:MAG: NAD(P)H-hydrate dehydratase [Methanomicrobiales archaeon]|nr:NAD(P)H-hydrate dehydratase [Methanomicrobiales archaeon]
MRWMREFLETGVISPERMRVVEGNAVALGVDTRMMMESAGTALARAVREQNPARVLILCGKGNNGGDGLVAARYLQWEMETEVIYADQGPMSELMKEQLGILSSCAISLHPVQCPADIKKIRALFTRADVIVDALLGTGATGTLREPLASLVRYANRSHIPIISADVPTPGIRPTRIIAFHRPKLEGCECAEIGIPLEAECCTGPGDITLIPQKPPDAHKGAGGTVLVVGGGPYQGAPYLVGLAALRAGADVVRIASPVFLPYPDLIHEPLEGDRIREEHLTRLIPLAEKADAVVCGNGLGTRSHGVVRDLAPHCTRLVLDADALRTPLPEGKETIYTPHAGEFQRMTRRTPPPDLIKRARMVKKAATSGVILLKGETDVISDGERVRFNRTGCPGMTVGGTGDVLAGVTGALFCRLPAFDAACIAAYANGKAGEVTEAEYADGMQASDLLEWIPVMLFGED